MASYASPNHKSLFTRFAQRAAWLSGHPVIFFCAAGIVFAWALTGPFFGFGNTWQLVINTSTTIVTFLMVFLIQNTQNRDTCAIQVKLDELIRATEGAQNTLLDLEELNDKELERLHQEYEQLARTARSKLNERGKPNAE
ncbi:MAG TPA: low affinity iron permease family protein [Tepidisphaeraceae bacterium]|nr:low affinity iron permease family protein [Tepidisphaeraceae bacterium]